MRFQRNTLSDVEYLVRIKAIMTALEGKGKCQNKEQATELFFLYNDRLTPRETKLTCGGCVARVYKRMVEYYKQLNNG